MCIVIACNCNETVPSNRAESCHGIRPKEYSQLLPCGHLAITDTPLLRTGAEVPGITPTVTDSLYYGHEILVPMVCVWKRVDCSEKFICSFFITKKTSCFFKISKWTSWSRKTKSAAAKERRHRWPTKMEAPRVIEMNRVQKEARPVRKETARQRQETPRKKMFLRLPLDIFTYFSRFCESLLVAVSKTFICIWLTRSHSYVSVSVSE